MTSQVSESFSLNARLGYLTGIEGNYQQAYMSQIGFQFAW